jgi:GPI inositol-deacylase
MYEDYLENFVFKTAATIALKLFGRVKESKFSRDKEEEKVVCSPQISDTDAKSNQNDESNKRAEQISGEDLLNQRGELDKNEQQARAEYEAISEGMSELNFHFPIFLLLLVITSLSVPSVVTWAKKYHVSRALTSDPYLLYATVIISSLGFIWQMKTPRNVLYYKVVSNLLYVSAVFSVLYCQDAIYRLNYVIVAVFLLIALHQMVSPKGKQRTNIEKPGFFDNLKTYFDRVRTIKGFFSK